MKYPDGYGRVIELRAKLAELIAPVARFAELPVSPCRLVAFSRRTCVLYSLYRDIVELKVYKLSEFRRMGARRYKHISYDEFIELLEREIIKWGGTL